MGYAALFEFWMSPSEINTGSWNPQILPICPSFIHEWNRLWMGNDILNTMY